MDQMVEIIAGYATASEERRLSMYLTHRDLRQQFTAIDMAVAEQAGALPSKKGQRVQAETKSCGIFRACWGWLKYCRALR